MPTPKDSPYPNPRRGDLVYHCGYFAIVQQVTPEGIGVELFYANGLRVDANPRDCVPFPLKPYVIVDNSATANFAEILR